MPKVSTIQNNFGAGEFSPLLNGRSDVKRYKQGLDTCLNYAPTIQGGLIRRSGTKFVNEVRFSAQKTRLVPFRLTSNKTYMLEFGHFYFRIYDDNALLVSPLFVATVYSESQIFEFSYVQRTNEMYFAHPDVAPQKLFNNGSTTHWSFSSLDYVGGPWLNLNNTTTTMTPSAAGGSITITASAAAGINEDTNTPGFQTTDVGRLIRYKPNSTADWGYAEITARASTTSITALVLDTLAGTAASGFWQLGTWSDTTGYPNSVVFHEDRLGFAGNALYGERVDLSETGNYDRFYPSENDGSVLATHALNFSLNATDVNAIQWLLSDEKGLAAGTLGGEWLIQPSNQTAALSPSDITAKRSTTYGSGGVDAVQISRSAIFVQRSDRKIRELRYYFDVQGFNSEDLTVLSEHITESGIKILAVQNTPQPTVWGVRNDGTLIGLTYERTSDSFKAGWHRHTIGGVSDAAGTQAIVESIAVAPSSDGARDEVWLVVQRYVDGAVVRHIEYITPEFEDTVEQKDAFFVDSGLTYDDPKTISGATQADPGVITATSHGFLDGNKVLISDVLGMTELNGNSYLVANKTTHTFELTDLLGVDLDTTGFTVYVSGGEVRKYVTTVSGLTHLEGEIVDILADGAVQPTKTVSSGAITLSESATTVHVGLGYNSDAKLLRADAGAADGTSFGKTRRTNRIGIMFHRSLGLKVGFSFDDLTELTFRKSSDTLSRAVPLFTGIESYQVDADYNFENQFCFRQDQPLPSIILAIMPQMHVMDR